VGMLDLPIRHCLVVKKGTKMGDIKWVRSHEQVRVTDGSSPMYRIESLIPTHLHVLPLLHALLCFLRIVPIPHTHLFQPTKPSTTQIQSVYPVLRAHHGQIIPMSPRAAS
jgi:hypothetical protein